MRNLNGMEMVALGLGLLALVTFVAARLSKRFRFWIFHAYVNFPLIGQISRNARMRKPRVSVANERLDKLFRQYRPLIGGQYSAAYFNNAAEYIHLAGDAGTHPIGALMKLFLLLLLAAEAFAFSFLLTTAISAESTEMQGFYWSFVIAFVLAIALAICGNLAGHSLRRAQALSNAIQDSIDEEAPLPESEEKTLAQLTRRIRLDDDQAEDEGTSESFGSQRQLNRMRKTDNEGPNYAFPIIYWIIMALFAGAIFMIRDADNAVTMAGRAVTNGLSDLIAQFGGEASGSGQPLDTGLLAAQDRVVWWANLILSFIFLLTQGIVFGVAHKNALLGRETRKALERNLGFNSYEDYDAAFDEMVLKADDSLKNLLAQFRDRYDMQPDSSLYRARLKKAQEDSTQPATAPPPPSPPPPEEPDVEAAADVIRPRKFGGPASESGT